MADPSVVARKDGKAFRTEKVQVEGGYVVDSGYELKLCEHREIGTTGRLIVIELTPTTNADTRPGFIGRWDERADHLDFDAVDAKGDVKTVSFCGHHPVRSADRRFDVEIKSAGKLVFKGVVTFGLGRDIALSEEARAGIACKADLIRGGRVVPEDS